MTPTSDERREVAEKLRRITPIELFAYKSLYEGVCNEIARCIGFDKAPNSVGESIYRIADLIDPTCHVVSEALHTGSFGCEEAGTEFTLSCGHTVIVDGDFPPSYCDECGARVVDDE